MTFNLIDRNNWERKELFDNYITTQTSFSMTVELDITTLYEYLKKNEYKLYPALIFMVTKVVNQHIEFRTTFNKNQELGYWSEMAPSYTMFNPNKKTFSSRCLSNTDSFQKFHNKYLEDQIAFLHNHSSDDETQKLENLIAISMIPWQSFTGFNLNINNNPSYLLPVTTFGKYFIREEKRILPVSLQVHHAVCDGYHASLFIEELQQLATNLTLFSN
ncbi:CatA-like O-acetyltransferase [Vagococcus sp.]|uniref:CatA-like O-acetyltransferase n=1 Tax=Vagococcus sp. TaxID=1933889 RepID=UPI002FC9FD5D